MTHPQTTPVRIGLLGCGNVGAAFAALVNQRAEAIEGQSGLRLEVTRVAVRSTSRDRGLTFAPGVLTHDATAVVNDPDVDLVVEVMGGIEPARSLITDALKAHKPVVTANKELLANVGPELYQAAETAGVDLLFEAAVGGAIPIMRALRESLRGERVRQLLGIVNGTTNYILTRMTEAGASYADALAEAQSLGYAERDPTADVEGFDAAAKAAILATVAFGAAVAAGDVYHEGISQITASDIDFARRLGYVVKLLAITAEHDDGTIGVRVHPAMVPNEHPLASVRDSYNAVFVEGAAAGNLMFYGRGAGGNPTASAVLGDVLDAAANLRNGSAGSLGMLRTARIRPIDDVESEYYLQLEVNDQPGVLARVATVFGQHGVSIRSMEQDGLGDAARLIFITHIAREASVQATLADLRGLDAVRKVNGLLRVIGTSA
ncbi:MAG: homoserine dehydrogenase [Acidimicrobiales bacterium]